MGETTRLFKVSAHAYSRHVPRVATPSPLPRRRGSARLVLNKGPRSSNKMSVSTLLLLLLFLVEVHSQQTFPYVSFNRTGPALADHSYVNISTVGSAGDNSDSVVCHSDLSTCCSGGQGIHRGDWYFPNGAVLPFVGNTVPIGLGRGAQIAIIRRTNDATGPTGIYRCRIATVTVHSDTDQSVGETVYVGLYPVDGGKLKHRHRLQISISP